MEVASLKVALSVLNHQYSLTNSQGDVIIVPDVGWISDQNVILETKKKMLSFAFTENNVCSGCWTPMWPLTFWFSSYTTRLWSGVSVFSDILELVPGTYQWTINKLNPLNTDTSFTNFERINLRRKLDSDFDSYGDISWPFVDLMKRDCLNKNFQRLLKM